jgi:hypothetical protein
MGMTTFWTDPDPDGGDAAVDDVAEPVVAGGTLVVEPDDWEMTPSLVTTYAQCPSGETAMAKSPRTGVPVIGSGMAASAVSVFNSTGVTAFGHTT